MQAQTFLHIILITTGIASLITLMVGINLIRNGRKSPYFRTRQRRIANGWGTIGIALVLAAIATLTAHFSDPLSTWINFQTTSTPPATLPTTISQNPPLTQTNSELNPTETSGPVLIATTTLPAGLEPTNTLTVTLTNAPGSNLTPTSINTHAPTQTATATPTITPVRTEIIPTPTIAATHAPTKIPSPTLSPYPTWTLSVPSPGPAATHAPTKIPSPTLTPYPTWTLSIPSPTPYSTHAPTPTNGPVQAP